jgi:hypothetical protein
MGIFGDASLHLLLDPDYWRPRLERLASRPRQLVIFPRPDLERPGLELRLRAHDNERLTALLARSAFAQSGETVQLRSCMELSSGELNWRAVEAGHTDLVFRYPGIPGARRLEDRVLDVLRVIHAVCSIESVDCGRVDFPGDPAEASEPTTELKSGSPSRPRSNGAFQNGHVLQPIRRDAPQKGLPDEFAIARFFRSRGWI